MTRHLDADVLARLAETEEIVLETRRKHGEIRQTPLWVVVVDGEAYIRSWHGPRGRWYHDLLRMPGAVLHVGGQTVPVRACRVEEPETLEQVSQAYLAKYNRTPYQKRYAPEMVLPETLPTTIRLEQAHPA